MFDCFMFSIQSNRLCCHEVYQVPLSHSLPVAWVMACHNHSLHADSCPGKLWQVGQSTKWGLQDLLEGDGITGQDDDRGSVSITHMNASNTHRTVWKNTHVLYMRMYTQENAHKHTHAHSWSGHKIKKKQKPWTSCCLVLYFCTVWPWKTQIRGHCITVPVNSPLYLDFKKSPYVQFLLPLSFW